MTQLGPDSPEAPGQPPIGWVLAAAGERAAASFRSLLPEGFHPRQFAVLDLVARAPQPLSQSEVVRILGIPASRVVAIVDQLEQDDLLSRQPDTRDRRARRLHVTARGQHFLSSLGDVVEQANQLAVEPLTRAEQDQLHRLLSRIVATPHAW